VITRLDKIAILSNILAQISNLYFMASNEVNFKSQIKTSDRSYAIF